MTADAHSLAGRLRLGLGLVLALALLGALLTWPGAVRLELADVVRGPSVRAEVLGVEEIPCPGVGEFGCRRAQVLLEGTPAGVRLGPADADPPVAEGDSLRVVRSTEGLKAVSFDRTPALGFVALCAVASLLALAPVASLRLVAVIVLTVALVAAYLLPALVAGASPIAATLISAVALVATLGLFGPAARPGRELAGVAALGALAISALVCALFLAAARISGIGYSGLLSALFAQAGQSSARALVLAGLLIALCGGLFDIAVRQVGQVARIEAGGGGGFAVLYRRALAGGSEGMTHSVLGLCLAYLGGALPALLLLSTEGLSPLRALNAEGVAQLLSGLSALGLSMALCFGLSTAVAAALLPRLEREHGEAALSVAAME